MNSLFLMQIGHQLVAIDKQIVMGIAVRDDDKIKLMEEDNKTYLPLPHGNRAIVFDLSTLISGKQPQFSRKREYYLIVAHEDNLLALTMNGKGRFVMANMTNAHPLPPAFPEQARKLIPRVVINGSDLIMLISLHALDETLNGAHADLQIGGQTMDMDLYKRIEGNG